MKNPNLKLAFTLMETVIAIGVLAVLLTGFLAVFTPAAQGIRRSLSAEQADRLTTALVTEMSTVRTPGAFPTGFDKAFDWLTDAGNPGKAIFVYQYRANPNLAARADGSKPPMTTVDGQPGEDYLIQPMARRADDPLFNTDIEAIDGPLFYVKPHQLVMNTNPLTKGTIGEIKDAAGNTISNAASYPEASLAFAADFYSVPSKSSSYISSGNFTKHFNDADNPIFTRNLAVRR